MVLLVGSPPRWVQAVQKRQKEGEHALCKAGQQGLSLAMDQPRACWKGLEDEPMEVIIV